ncbi:hypothetical protein M407DRAFT_104330 [Tulasnella calospora MUT 4182]|uniref:C2H2-type domain-containing protein n=1 Tax=Tulasnella calospora MUT 4182 TaxID=1051891 RepID=A0A0C3QFI5_9AGAM|nr:hypothetical protein M407DRAFT_104330 [Tulasnella calospora MUT 4182]
MPPSPKHPCPQCTKMLANPATLRRHINMRHELNHYYECLCGKRFSDPAACSRCKTSHLKSFGCPGCAYESGRKDSVKTHIQRKHPDQALFLGSYILILPPPEQPSIPSPVPLDPITSTITIHQPPIYAPIPLPWVPQSSPPYSEASTTSDGYSPFG